MKMVSRKEIISELKKFNTDLEKHVPGLDLDLLKETNLYNSSKNEDYFTLFAQNLVDLRTEIALMRKNLSTDVEGMVLRVVNEQQNNYSRRMNDFFVKAVLDVKETWDTRLSNFTDEVSEIKKGFNAITLQNENLVSSLKDINEDLLILKTSINNSKKQDDTSELKNRLLVMESLIKRLILNTERNNDLDKKISEISKNIPTIDTTRLESMFNKKITAVESEIGNLFLENNKLKSILSNSSVSEKLDYLENTLESLKQSSQNTSSSDKITKKIQELENQMSLYSQSVDEKTKRVSSDLKNLNSRISNAENKSEIFDKISELESQLSKVSLENDKLKNVISSSHQNEKLDSLESSLESLKQDAQKNIMPLMSLNQKVKELESKIEFFSNSVNKRNKEVESNLKSLSQDVLKVNKGVKVKEKNKDEEIDNNIEIVKMPEIKVEISKEISKKPVNLSKTSSKLLEIESRLSKLNSLR